MSFAPHVFVGDKEMKQNAPHINFANICETPVHISISFSIAVQLSCRCCFQMSLMKYFLLLSASINIGKTLPLAMEKFIPFNLAKSSLRKHSHKHAVELLLGHIRIIFQLRLKQHKDRIKSVDAAITRDYRRVGISLSLFTLVLREHNDNHVHFKP